MASLRAVSGLAVIGLAVLLAAPLGAQIQMTTGEALELAFPKCEVTRQQATLDGKARAAIGKRIGGTFAKAMVFPYVARRDGEVVGTAWFDVHTVRSKKQLLMVVVAPDQTVQRVEVLAFAEPRRYAAPRPWLARLGGLRLGGVQPGRDVPRITGATLTVKATTDCVERVLAVHREVFGAPPPPKPEPRPKTGVTPASGEKSKT